MLMVQLIYASRTNDDISREDLNQILATSQQNNTRVDVTGALLYNSRFFLQCLEGSRVAVNDTYMRILRDPRHMQPALLDYAEISERDFSGWAMGYIGEGVLNKDIFLRYSAYSQFDPFTLSGASARGLLLDLARGSSER